VSSTRRERAPSDKAPSSGAAGAADALGDPRLTLVGLFAESFTGLRNELEQRLRRECGLSLQRFVLLLRLARSPDRRLRMSDLADQTSLTPSGLTRAIDRMEAAGLVQRVACLDDRRGAYAALTEAGLDVVAAAVGPHLQHLDDTFVGLLSHREQQDLERILRKLRDRVNPGAARPPKPI
jgi:MarR family transcriptional regulator, 2-MHQ and catechol-resistance regulon repressor